MNRLFSARTLAAVALALGAVGVTVPLLSMADWAWLRQAHMRDCCSTPDCG